MHLRYALLALLADGEAHGYELLKRFDRQLGPFWHPNIGQVYQLLHELEARGLTHRRDLTVGTRLRRSFRLTTRGERALERWVTRKPGWPPPLRDEIFVRLLATERGGAGALAMQIERQETEYTRHRELIDRNHPVSDASLTRRLTHTAAVAHTDAHLGWLRACRTLLDEEAQLAS